MAAILIYISAKGLIIIPDASSYKDNGIHTLEPYQVLSVQVQNTSAYSRDRRMNPTKTVYMVYYRAMDSSGYQWSLGHHPGTGPGDREGRRNRHPPGAQHPQ